MTTRVIHVNEMSRHPDAVYIGRTSWQGSGKPWLKQSPQQTGHDPEDVAAAAKAALDAAGLVWEGEHWVDPQRVPLEPGDEDDWEWRRENLAEDMSADPVQWDYATDEVRSLGITMAVAVLDAILARGWRAPGPRVTAAEREAIECGLVYIDRGRGRSSMPDPDGVAYVDRCVATLRAMLDGDQP